MEFETSRCVVLNATYEPITVVPSKRALILIMEGKAMVVEEHPYLVVRSPSATFKVPVTVVLKRYVRGRQIFTTSAGLTQKNLYLRDNYTCQYCLRHKNEFKQKEFLTRDHIIPECKGGKSTWENLVTACSTCNNKKGNLDLLDTQMKLLKPPIAPTLFELWMKNNKGQFTLNMSLDMFNSM
jgi:5-methylcytosine-specific restriction endonuclease McrA